MRIANAISVGQQVHGPPPSGVTIGPIDFESPTYTDGDDLATYAAWESVRVLRSNRVVGDQLYLSDGVGVMRVDTHTDHKPGQVIDNSTHGENNSIHQTQLDTSDHEVELNVFPDSMAGASGHTGVGAVVRAGNDGTSGSVISAYIVRLRHFQAVSQIQILMVVDDDHEQVYLGPNLHATYPNDQVRLLRARIVGDFISVFIDGNLEYVHDTDLDASKHSVGRWVGANSARLYGGSGTNTQLFWDDFQAQDL